MAGLNRILIVGGGIAGMAAAMLFSKRGMTVDIVDLDPAWRVYGAGITITGITLRAYKRLGLLEQIEREGAITNGMKLFTFDGTQIAEMDEPAIEKGLPATGGILRPVLHRIMSEEVLRLGVSVRLGLTARQLSQTEDGVVVSFTDGSEQRYDLVVGADGINSGIRAMLFPEAVRPHRTGQGSWRVVADRPVGFDKGEIYLGHENLVGITACSPDKVYVYILNPDPGGERTDQAHLLDRVRALLADFGGNIRDIREALDPESSIVYRPLEAALQPLPWHRGRVVLLGDAVHATTPHLASGAGMAVEDAIILDEALAARPEDIEAALDHFEARRFERCRFVVESSIAIGQAQLDRLPAPQTGAMIGAALHRLAEPV